MSAFPVDFPVAEGKILVNASKTEQLPPKEELVEAAWLVQGYILSQLCGVPTLTIGLQTKADPVIALEMAIEHAESSIPVTQANIPWAVILLWVLDMLRLALKDRV
jgi:hypothetical protein